MTSLNAMVNPNHSPESLRVFISYSWDSDPHKQRVLELTQRLRQDGVDAWMDRFTPFPEEGWPRWMENEIQKAFFVVVIATEKYAQRFAGNAPSGTGLGATWEGAIIAQELYDVGARNNKFLPLIFTQADAQHIPKPLKPFAHFRVDSDAGYDALYRQITNQHEIAPVPLGKKRVLAATPASKALPSLPIPPIHAISANKPRHNLPFSPNPFFTGRETILKDLHQALSTKTAAALPQPQAVHGLGGVGKTQLAVEYAWRHLQDYHAVLWAGAASPSELQANLARLAEVLTLPQSDAREQEVKVRAIRNWLQTSDRWLLILDNADTSEAVEAVQSALPVGLNGHVIVTSRRTNWGVAFGDLEVNVLPIPVATDLLLKRAAKSGFNAGTSSNAAAVARELDGLPLALEQAGAYIARHHIGFSDYLELLKGSRKRLLTEGSKGGTGYQMTVATTWLVSEEQLCPLARAILQIAAFLAPDEIPRALFIGNSKTLAEAITLLTPENSPSNPEPLERLAINEALAQLADHSLMELEADTFACHRLLQAVLWDRLPPDARKSWGQVAVRLVNAYAPPEPQDVRTWSVWNQLRPHVIKLLSRIGDDANSNAAKLMNELGLHLDAKALFDEAEPFYRRALDIDEKSVGLEHPQVAVSLTNLAQLLQATNRMAEAEPLMRRALVIDEKSFGPDHPKVAIRLSSLARLLHATKRMAEAEPLMRRALVIDEKHFGSEHPDVARDLNNLAQLLQATNRMAEAEPLMRRTLVIVEKSFGPDHPSVAICLNNLGQLLQDKKRLSAAGPLARRAADIMIRSLGFEHPNSQIMLDNYKGILSAMKLPKSDVEAKIRDLLKTLD